MKYFSGWLTPKFPRLFVVHSMAILLTSSLALALLLILLFGRSARLSSAAGPTYVKGIIASDTTWTMAYSPYIVTGNIIISDTITYKVVTLTIEPGVTVKFDGDYYIRVDGTLKAIGTIYDHVTFTSNKVKPAKGDWGYIRFSANSTPATLDADGRYIDGSTLQYVTAEYGGIGGATVRLLGHAAPFISHSTIRYSAGSGIEVQTGSPVISNNTISSHEDNGINVVGGAPTLSSNVISENGKNGIQVSAGSPLIKYNTLSSNQGEGLYVDSGSPSIANNIIQDNVRSGIGFRTNDPTRGDVVTVDHNTVERNTYGGIRWYTPITELTISNNTIRGNQSGYGGGIFLWLSSGYSSKVTVSSNTISGNTATLGGGGVAINASHTFTTTLQNNSILYNTAPYGGGIYILTGNTVITATTLVKNTNLDSKGGNIHLASTSGRLIINNSNLAENNNWEIRNETTSDIDATNNYWGTAETATIGERIYDFYDDFDLGKVNYQPFLISPSASAPLLPTLVKTFLPITLKEYAAAW